MLQNSKLENVLFLDIETVSEKSTFSELDDDFKNLWTKKAKNINRYEQEEFTENTASELYETKAAIFAEYAKIVCISVGFLRKNKSGLELRIKSFYGNDEVEILESFRTMVDQHFDQPKKFYICGHNIKEFDVPFLGRRLIINNVKLPSIFNLVGKKPWESKHLLDTLEMWKFGDYKNYVSLDLLAKVMGVESPKVNLDGSKVGAAYWKEGRLEDIKDYCELDVVTSAKVFLRINGSDDVAKVVRK